MASNKTLQKHKIAIDTRYIKVFAQTPLQSSRRYQKRSYITSAKGTMDAEGCVQQFIQLHAVAYYHYNGKNVSVYG